ncbi:MAG: lgt [Chlamydiales bacterium]|nr:lgt [Chlamydiales bacterium]
MLISSFLCAFFYWNPAREAFYLPWVHYPIVWYSLFLSLGCFLAYLIIIAELKKRHEAVLMISDYQALTDALAQLRSNNDPFAQAIPLEAVSSPKKLSACLLAIKGQRPLPEAVKKCCQPPAEAARSIADLLSWYLILGMIIGARLFEVLFYDLDYYLEHPLLIFYTWNGGLASHGGILGLLTGLYLAKRHLKPVTSLSMLEWMDLVAFPSLLVAFFIRIGNFFNQEIIGYPTDLPWGVIFGNPLDHSAPLPRHPTQLYEAFTYLSLFFLFAFLKGKKFKQKGLMTGYILLSALSARFLLEFLKVPQEAHYQNSFLHMGQLLSLPLIFASLLLVWTAKKNPL